MNELPKELTDSLETANAQIVAINIDGDLLKVTFELRDEFTHAALQTWEIECEGVKSYKFEKSRNFIGPGEIFGIDVISDHPLLYAYNEIQSELYFNDTSDRLEHLLAAVVETHYQLVGEWFSLPVKG